MVPYGWRLINQMQQELPDVDITVFSWLWTDQSDNRNNTVLDYSHDWRFPEASKEIFDYLGHRHVFTDQKPILDELYKRYLIQDAIPRDNPNYSFFMPRSTFDRFNGQIVGFILALEHWREELEEYDWIVRSRWDTVVDIEVIKLMTTPTDVLWAPTFYTKFVDITHGQVQISGDTIYGPRRAWFDTIPSWDKSSQDLIDGSRQRWHWIKQNCRSQDIKNEYFQKYYAQGWWFNSHFLWTTLFLTNPYCIIRSRGESFGIHPSCATVPLEEFELGHAQLGPDFRSDKQRNPLSTTPLPALVVNNRPDYTDRLDRIARLQQRIDQHRNKG